jgi:hypothetical protein
MSRRHKRTSGVAGSSFDDPSTASWVHDGVPWGSESFSKFMEWERPEKTCFKWLASSMLRGLPDGGGTPRSIC